MAGHKLRCSVGPGKSQLCKQQESSTWTWKWRCASSTWDGAAKMQWRKWSRQQTELERAIWGQLQSRPRVVTMIKPPDPTESVENSKHHLYLASLHYKKIFFSSEYLISHQFLNKVLPLKKPFGIAVKMSPGYFYIPYHSTRVQVQVLTLSPASCNARFQTQQVMPQQFECLPPTWQTECKFLTPGFVTSGIWGMSQ